MSRGDEKKGALRPLLAGKSGALRHRVRGIFQYRPPILLDLQLRHLPAVALRQLEEPMSKVRQLTLPFLHSEPGCAGSAGSNRRLR